MDLQIQAMVLKVVEEKHFYRLGDVLEPKTEMQIIAAADRDQTELAEKASLRSNLYLRFNKLQLRIPLLPKRREDIPIIADRLVEQPGHDIKRGPVGISRNARAALAGVCVSRKYPRIA